MPFVCTTDRYFEGQIVGDQWLNNASELPRLWARTQATANICRQHGNGNETAELIGTTFTARDMISVVDTLEEDGLLRYWGRSDT